MLNIDEIEKGTAYTVANKYPYELGALYENVELVAIIYDYKVAAKFNDVLSRHARISQMNPSIPKVDELVFLLFRKKENNELILTAYDYIEDITDYFVI